MQDLPVYYFQCLGVAERRANGFEAPLEHERLRVEVLDARILRVSISRAGRFDPAPSVSVCRSFDVDAPVAFALEQDGEQIRLSTETLRVTATRQPFALRAERADGSLLFETALDPKTGESRAYGERNNRFVLHRNHRMEDAFYGLGEKSGSFNRIGRDFTLWNTDVMNGGATEEFTRDRPPADPRSDNLSTEFDPYYISIPFFYHHPADSVAMSGHFIDNPWRGHFDFPHHGAHRMSFVGGHYCEYIFAEPGMPEILRDYTALTGRMAMPPLWALGHHQCRWYDYQQADVLKLARTYREKNIPCDVIWLDIDYMDGFRVFTWDAEKFPDPAALIRELRAMGFRVITIIDPGVKHERGNPLFEEGLAKRLFCENTIGTPFVGEVWPGKTVFPDFSLPETRAWWGELNAEHVKSGIAGIWNDMNEPATAEPGVEDMRFGHGVHDHARCHNEYATLMAMGTVEGLRETMPGLRTFVLSRAGSPGIQRYAANWMGDNISTWEHLGMSIPMALGLGISGQPFVGADVGGFGRHCHGELLARWYQCAAFTPFFRNHNGMGSPDQYPWAFGPAVESLCADSIRERYRLMPYLYTCFAQAAESGAPVQRPLVFEIPGDPAARNINDEFLLGEHLLVAPVLKPETYTRPVYLPEGIWLDWRDATPLTGGKTHIASSPPERIPVYVRAGAVIPFWDTPPESTMNVAPEEVGLLLVCPADENPVVSELHEDDGLTTAHETGAYLRTRFELRREDKTLRLSARVSGNGYPEHRRTRFRLRLFGAAFLPASNPGLNAEGSDLLFENTGADFDLTISLCGTTA